MFRNIKGQKTTVPNSNVTHQQDVFGGACFSTGDELTGVFEDPNSGTIARARKLQVLNDRKNKLKVIKWLMREGTLPRS